MVFVFRAKRQNNEKSNTELELFELLLIVINIAQYRLLGIALATKLQNKDRTLSAN